MQYELEACEECGSRRVEMLRHTHKKDCFVVCLHCGNSGGHFDNECDAALAWNGGFVLGYLDPVRRQAHED